MLYFAAHNLQLYTMKQISPLVLLLLAQASFAQVSGSDAYYKIAPSLQFVEKSDPSATMSAGLTIL
jgi:hypothetical protein